MSPCAPYLSRALHTSHLPPQPLFALISLPRRADCGRTPWRAQKQNYGREGVCGVGRKEGAGINMGW